MYYVQILKSLKDNELYLKYTNNLLRKIKEHNSKLNTSTKFRTPLKLIYYEAYHNRQDATKHESNLKLHTKP